MYEIRKTFEFSAAHHLMGLSKDHPCMSPHGHNYAVEIVLSRETLNGVGFVVDYRELGEFKVYIDTKLDHKDLNTVLAFNPTAENLAKHFYEWAHARWPEVVAARVSETPKTWAEYRPTEPTTGSGGDCHHHHVHYHYDTHQCPNPCTRPHYPQYPYWTVTSSPFTISAGSSPYTTTTTITAGTSNVVSGVASYSGVVTGVAHAGESFTGVSRETVTEKLGYGGPHMYQRDGKCCADHGTEQDQKPDGACNVPGVVCCKDHGTCREEPKG